MASLNHLFRPITIREMEVKNRLVMAPMGTNLGEPDGTLSQDLIHFLTVRARGGVGLIITEDVTIDPSATYNVRTLGLFHDRFIPSWRELCRNVHAHGARIAPQLIHPSFNSRFALAGVQAVAASPIPSLAVREIPREATIEELAAIIKKFGDAARRAREAGCDAIQIHCAHRHHLLGSFITPLYNKRTDEYGGSLDGLLRLPLEVIRRIRGEVGSDFPILIRVSGQEFEPGGRSLQETQYIAPLLVEAGADAVHVSAGTTNTPWVTVPPMGSPQAPNAALAAAIKQVIKVPVITVGRITDPRIAEWVLETGQADMIAMGRALLADPDLPNKAATNNLGAAIPCMGDTACLVSLMMDKKIVCMVNPTAGREREKTLVPVKSPKRILIIGGGPAGLQAAWTAAIRGHKVTLVEKNCRLGGQLVLAAFPPTKQELAKLMQYLVGKVYQAGVRVELDKEATLQSVREFEPDVVILATGGKAYVPDSLPGVNGPNVVTAWDVLAGKVLAGPKILVIGGGQLGCETADFVAHPVDDLKPGGNRVTVLEMFPDVATEGRSPARSLLIQRLRAKGVRIVTSAQVDEILFDGARFTCNGVDDEVRGMDTIILAMGSSSNNYLANQLAETSIPFCVIGDANRVNGILEAIAEGFEVGRTI